MTIRMTMLISVLLIIPMIGVNDNIVAHGKEYNVDNHDDTDHGNNECCSRYHNNGSNEKNENNEKHENTDNEDNGDE